MKRTFFWDLGLAATLTFNSCEIEEKINTINSIDDGVEALNEYAFVSKQFSSASNTSEDGVAYVEGQIDNVSGAQKKLGGVSIMYETTDGGWPVTTTIDFGTGVLGEDGITRKGKLIVVSTARFVEAGSKHTTTFDDYYQDDYKMEGTRVATNAGRNADQALQFEVVISDGKLIDGDKSISYEQHSTRTWVVGESTLLNIWDDEYSLEGTQSGVSSKGIAYQLDIVDPLFYVVVDREITKGSLKVTIENLPQMILDYTTSTIRIGEQSFPFTK